MTGTFTFAVTATDANGCSGSRSYELTINQAPPPTVALTPSILNYGVVNSGGTLQFATRSQTLTLTQAGAGTVTWTASANQPWITVSPSAGSGPGIITVSINNTGGVLPATGVLSGTVTVTTTGATSPPASTVNLTVLAPSQATAPFGVVDTPTEGQTGVTGSLPVTGWAVDDVDIARLRVLREPVGSESGLVFIGDAIFVTGARPDVAALYPTTPLHEAAGWGVIVLTNYLPNQGNGTFRLQVFADDVDGHSTLLGTRTITCTNATATAPFGAIDTPGPGSTASGGAYVNFGWALAAQPTGSGRFIPFDGSTIVVYVDSLPVGTVTYNNARPDIQTLFPGYANTDGAIGFRLLDTTALANGVHTLAWVVTDNLGAAAGIGSRFFTVSNSTGVGSVAALGSSPARPASRQLIDASSPVIVDASAISRVAVRPWRHPADARLCRRRAGGTGVPGRGRRPPRARRATRAHRGRSERRLEPRFGGLSWLRDRGGRAAGAAGRLAP